VTRKKADWLDARIDPLPVDAPPYRLFVGAPLASVWVAGYDEDRWTVTDIDGRFSLDRTTMPAPDPEEGFGRFRRGDVVIWVGPSTDGYTEEDVIWQPSLVVQATGIGDGMVRILSIRDANLKCHGIDRTRDLDIDWGSHLGGSRQPEIVDSSVLDLWQLDVWCRDCGHLASPVRWGLGGAPRTRDDDGTLLPWPEGVEVDAGCDISGEPHLYVCERCSTTWGRDRLRSDP
jgi:hypothetical protein